APRCGCFRTRPRCRAAAVRPASVGLVLPGLRVFPATRAPPQSVEGYHSCMGQFGIGQPVTRLEDARLLRGQGRYVNDINLPGQAHLVFVRSPHAHAAIRAIDTSAALAAPGVLGVYSSEDLAGDALGTIPVSIKRSRPDGSPMFTKSHRGLADARVRYVGDPVAA